MTGQTHLVILWHDLSPEPIFYLEFFSPHTRLQTSQTLISFRSSGLQWTMVPIILYDWSWCLDWGYFWISHKHQVGHCNNAELDGLLLWFRGTLSKNWWAPRGVHLFLLELIHIPFYDLGLLLKNSHTVLPQQSCGALHFIQVVLTTFILLASKCCRTIS